MKRFLTNQRARYIVRGGELQNWEYQQNMKRFLTNQRARYIVRGENYKGKPSSQHTVVSSF
jgi:uncharacterized protein (DUF1330 family)